MFIFVNRNPYKKRVGDCVVRALSYATNQSWDDTFNALCDEAYRRKEMPSWNPTWWAYLKNQGWVRHMVPDACPDCAYSVDMFCEDFPQGTYILFIPTTADGVGHVTVVDHGDILDTWDCSDELPLIFWQKEDYDV